MIKNSINKIAVLGGGSWATAIVKILSESSEVNINWWIRNIDQVNHIINFKHNPKYLSDAQIDTQKVNPSHMLEEVLRDSSIVIVAVPAAFVKDVLEPLPKNILKGKIVVSAVKGMIPGDNLLISEFLEKNFKISKSDLCMISGPCHSEEVAMEKQSYLTIAGNDYNSAKTVADKLSCRYIKTSVNIDLYGVEYAAVMKNIYGIACGVARGVNYGDNFQAVLVSNAMSEMKNILNEFHPKDRNITSSAYMGDLLVTAYSQFSRNRTLGNMLGRGYSVKSALVEMNMVAEGYYGVKCIYELVSERKIDTPIIKAVYNIIYEKISPSIEFKILENQLY